MADPHAHRSGDHDRRHHRRENREVNVAQRVSRQPKGMPASHDSTDRGDNAGHQSGRRRGGDRGFHSHAEGLQDRSRERAAAGAGQRGKATDRRRHTQLCRALRWHTRDHQTVLQEALVDADRHHEERKDHLQKFGGRKGQQRGPDQDADQDSDGPGPEERQVEIPERELLARGSDRAR